MGNTAVFVSINAIVEPAHKAVAASGLYLSMPVGMITGIAITNALLQEVMQKHLDRDLAKLGLSVAERVKVPGASWNAIRNETNAEITDHIEGCRECRVYLQTGRPGCGRGSRRLR